MEEPDLSKIGDDLIERLAKLRFGHVKKNVKTRVEKLKSRELSSNQKSYRDTYMQIESKEKAVDVQDAKTNDDVLNCQVTRISPGNDQVLLFMQTIFFLFGTWLNALAKDVACCKEEMKMIRCSARYNEVSENPDSDLPDAKISPPLQLQLDDIQLRLTKVQTLLSGKIRCNVIGNDVDVNEVEEVAPDIVGEVDEPLEDIDAYSTPLGWCANLTSCFSFG